MDRLSSSKRHYIQLGFFIAQNPFLGNFFSGRIYRGALKQFCTPGLNCYSCPAAAFSCPIGVLQTFFAGARQSISLFAVGFLMSVGVFFGRFICGYVCPMGLLQDLLYKAKTPKALLKLRRVSYVKYAVLVVLVWGLPFFLRHPLTGLGTVWFCAYVCPSGTIFAAGPLLLSNDFLRAMIGVQFWIKVGISGMVVVVSLFVFRVFCRVICPLGAIFALCNRVSVMHMRCDLSKCSSCKTCAAACRVRIDPNESPNAAECVRCGDCVRACGKGALRVRVGVVDV